jgi:hypothetical protein
VRLCTKLGTTDHLPDRSIAKAVSWKLETRQPKKTNRNQELSRQKRSSEANHQPVSPASDQRSLWSSAAAELRAC